eukprot:gene1825-4421_t
MISKNAQCASEDDYTWYWREPENPYKLGKPSLIPITARDPKHPMFAPQSGIPDSGLYVWLKNPSKYVPDSFYGDEDFDYDLVGVRCGKTNLTN